MQSFGVRLEATVFGAKQFERLERVARKAGVEIGHLKEQGKKVEINGKETTAFAISLNKLTKEARKAIIEEIKLIQEAKNLTKYYGMAAASFVEFDDSIEDITKGLKAQQRELDNAAKAAERFEKATANALIRANLLQKQRIENQNTARELNKATDAAEYNRRRDQRQLDDQEKFNRQQQLMQQRHAMAMQRINAYHSGTGGPFGTITASLGNASIVKVFAYDAIRRTLTNMYQTMGKIGDTVQQWVIDSIEFNDELERAKTMFMGFGLIGRRNKDGTPMTIDQAQTSSNQDDRRAAALGEEFAKSAIDQAMMVSLKTGQDFSDLIAASRQTLPDTISKIKQKNGESPLVKEGANLLDLNKFLLESASVFKMLDPSKKLTWHMVALGEAIAGSSGSKKDTGMQAIMSLMRRENIKVQAEDALALSKAVNSGNIPKMREVLMQILDKAGQSQAVLENMYKRTLAPRIEAVKTQFKSFGANFTMPLTHKLKDGFDTYSNDLVKVVQSRKLSQILEKSGKTFAKSFEPFFHIIEDLMDLMIENPQKIGTELERLSRVGADVNKIIANVGLAFFNFMRGFLGTIDGKKPDVKSIIDFTEKLKAGGAEFGIQAKKTFSAILRLSQSLTDNLLPAISTFNTNAGELYTTLENLDAEWGITNFISQAAKMVVVAFSEVFLLIGKFINNLGFKDGMFSDESLQRKYEANRAVIDEAFPGYRVPLPSDDYFDRSRMVPFDADAAFMERFGTKIDVANQPKISNPAIMTPASPGFLAPIGYKPQEVGPLGLPYAPTFPKSPINNVSVSPIFDAMQMVSNVGWNPKLPKNATTAPPQVDMSGMHTKVMQIVSDEAKKTSSTMVEAIKTGRKPIEFRSAKVEQKNEFHFGPMTINSDNAQDFIDQLLKLGKGKVAVPGKNGPWSNEYADKTNFGARRGD